MALRKIENTGTWKTEKGNTGFHSVEMIWKKLWTCEKTK
jgi:hypothetical protein